MDNSRANIRIISLILVIVMSMLTLVSCLPSTGDGTNSSGNSNNNTGNNSNDNEGGNNNNPDNGTDDPHTCSFGDWAVIKSATATEDGLCERKCECGNVEQKIIPASVKEYTITYIDAPQHNNPTKYTVNDSIDLQAAVWNGLSFAYWSDKDGNIIEEIPYGTEGNITLYANWKYTLYFIKCFNIKYSNIIIKVKNNLFSFMFLPISKNIEKYIASNIFSKNININSSIFLT